MTTSSGRTEYKIRASGFLILTPSRHFIKNGMKQFYEFYFKPEMDYDFLLNNLTCDCNQQTIVGGIITFLLIMFVDCVYTCRLNNRVQELNSENRTLRNVILTSVDRTLVRLLKNGNDSNNSDEE